MTAIFTSQIIYHRMKKSMIFQAHEHAPLLCFLADYWWSHRPHHFNVTLNTHIIISVFGSQVFFDLGHLLTLQLNSPTLKELITQLIETFLFFPDQNYQINFSNAPPNFNFTSNKYPCAINKISS